MTPKHTSGPWATHLVDETIVVIPRRPLPQQISTLGHSEVADDEDYANAHLIAAAPELLEALEAEEEWRGREAAGEIDPEWDYETMVAAKRRAAISKAKGEQQ